MPLSLLNHSALALFAQRTRIPTSARSIGFCAIWVCISSSSSSLGTRPFAAWATRGSLGTRAQQEEATRSSLGTRPVALWPLGLEFSLGFFRRPSSAHCSSLLIELSNSSRTSSRLFLSPVLWLHFVVVSGFRLIRTSELFCSCFLPSNVTWWVSGLVGNIVSLSSVRIRGLSQEHSAKMRLQLLTTLFFFTSAITTLALHSPKTASFRRYSSLARASYDSWEERANAIFEKDKRPVILFDGICNMCNGGMNLADAHTLFKIPTIAFL